MGMFDTISIPVEMLPKDSSIIDYISNLEEYFVGQTKGLDCTLSEYRVTKDNILERRFCETRWVDGDEGAESMIDRLGHIEEVGEPWWEQYPVHAILNVYEYNTKKNVWVEFDLIFTRSKLEEIKLVKFDKINAG